MRFAFDEGQVMFRDVLRGSLKRSAPISRIRAWSEAGDIGGFDTIAAENGWSGLGTPEKDGGQGGGLVELAILFEELGRAAAPSDLAISSIGLGLPLARLVEGGVGALSGVLSGSATVALLSPSGRPCDDGPIAIVTNANRLSGSVPLVLGAPAATHFLALVQAGDAFDLWLVNASDEGVRIRSEPMLDRTRRYGEVTLSDASGVRLGRISKKQVTDVAARSAVLVAAESLGLARRMLEMTTEYVTGRIQFGAPVGSFQAVKHAAAEALVDIEAAHSGVYYAAWALENDAADGMAHAWIAKAFATEIAARVADRALFLHGAIGYTWEYDLQFFYKRAKANVELFGSPPAYRGRIADLMALA